MLNTFYVRANWKIYYHTWRLIFIETSFPCLVKVEYNSEVKHIELQLHVVYRVAMYSIFLKLIYHLLHLSWHIKRYMVNGTFQKKKIIFYMSIRNILVFTSLIILSQKKDLLLTVHIISYCVFIFRIYFILHTRCVQMLITDF